MQNNKNANYKLLTAEGCKKRIEYAQRKLSDAKSVQANTEYVKRMGLETKVNGDVLAAESYLRQSKLFAKCACKMRKWLKDNHKSNRDELSFKFIAFFNTNYTESSDETLFDTVIAQIEK